MKKMSTSSTAHILKNKRHLGDEEESNYSFSEPVPANNFSKAIFKKDKGQGKSFSFF